MRFVPHGVKLDFKRSSFRQLTKFLKHYTREGLIGTRQRQGDTVVTSISRTHSLLAAYAKPVEGKGAEKKSSKEREMDEKRKEKEKKKKEKQRGCASHDYEQGRFDGHIYMI